MSARLSKLHSGRKPEAGYNARAAIPPAIQPANLELTNEADLGSPKGLT